MTWFHRMYARYLAPASVGGYKIVVLADDKSYMVVTVTHRGETFRCVRRNKSGSEWYHEDGTEVSTDLSIRIYEHIYPIVEAANSECTPVIIERVLRTYDDITS